MTTPEPPPVFHAEDRVFHDAAIMAREVAADVAGLLQEAIEARGRASLVVPGGTTPGLFFDALADADIDWPRVTVTPSDERWVAINDAGSNEKLIREHLLLKRAAAAEFISWRAAGETRDDAATALSARVAALLPFDVCALGLGTDGHVASVIPAAPTYRDLLAWGSDTHVKPVDAPGAAGAAERLTLTLATLFRSRLIVLLTKGAAKRAVLDAARRGEGEGPIVPIMAPQAVPVWACWAPE